MKLKRDSHSCGESNAYLMFVPAYRRPIFRKEKVRQLTKAYLEAKAEQMEVDLKAVDFGPDHAHLFLVGCKNWGESKLAKHLKGYSSRMMRKNHHPLFQDQLWGDRFWSSSYFYRSVGSVTRESMQFYVEHSQKKHWEAVDHEYYLHRSQSRSLSTGSDLLRNIHGL